jgi:hypothetical protein
LSVANYLGKVQIIEKAAGCLIFRHSGLKRREMVKKWLTDKIQSL